MRNWLRSPRSSLRWLADALADAARGPAVLQVRPGWSIACPRAAARTFRAHVVDPEQAAELDGFIAECQAGMRLFDVGAHFGLFSFAALHFGGPGARAVAVDPSRTAVRMARRIARLNGVAGRMEVVRAAAGSAEGELAMVDVGVQAAGYFVTAGAGHPGRERTVVPAVTVDGLARRFGAPTHIKVDVEGAEAEVLRGALAVLGAPGAPVLFLELHHGMVRERGGDPGAALLVLGDLGYDVRDPSGRAPEPEELLRRELVRVVARRRPG